MTKLFTVLLLAGGAIAQDVNATVLAQLAQNLTSAGFNQLANVAASIVNTTAGKSLLHTLTTTNDNFTIFAPTDAAIQGADQSSLKDADNLAAIMSYHVVPGYYGNQSLFFNSPNNTILPTFLNSTTYVHLQGNSSQVLSASVKGGNLVVNNQNGSTVSVDKISTAGRFTILQIGHVFTPPQSLADVAKQAKLTMFASALEQGNLTDKVNNAQGITIFAPTDDALQAALGKLGAEATNQTIIETVIQNHIINGTTVYTSQFDNANYTSAAGEALNFYVYNNTITVYSGKNNTFKANVTTRDLLASNGVIHIIDAVLANTDRDDSAASSAYSSATSAAASSASAHPTGGSGPVGGGPNAATRVSSSLAVVFGAAVAGVFLVAL